MFPQILWWSSLKAQLRVTWAQHDVVEWLKILLTIVHQLNLPKLSLLVAQAIISEIEIIRLGADTDYAKTIYLYRLSVCN